MYSKLNTITTLELAYDGRPPHSAIRRAQFGADAYIKRRAASERFFFNKEAVNAVFAISRRRQHARTPRADHRLKTLTNDLADLRAKALASPVCRSTRRAL